LAGSSVLHPAVLLLIGTAVCNARYQLLTRKIPGDGLYTTLFYSALVGAAALTLALPMARRSMRGPSACC